MGLGGTVERSSARHHGDRRMLRPPLPVQVCCESGRDEAVFPLSVSLMDRFLSSTLSLPLAPCCLAASCILIASKLSESDIVTADTLCAAAEHSFQTSDLRVSWSQHKKS